MSKQKKDVSINIRVTIEQKEFIQNHFDNFSKEVRKIITRKMREIAKNEESN